MRQPFTILSIVALTLGVLSACWRSLPADGQETTDSTAPITVTPADANNASGDILLDSVINSLENVESVQVRLRLQVSLFDQQLYGPANYLQQGRGADKKFRLDLSLQTLDGKLSLSQVNDGQRLWIYDATEGNATLSVVDLESIRRRLDNDSGIDSPRQSLLLGGVPKLLATLQENLQFQKATRVQRENDTLWRIQGAWRPTRLQKLLGPSDDGAADGAKVTLPPHLFSDVVLYVDEESLFPVRVEFFRQPQRKRNRPAKLLLAIDFFEQQFDQPIDEWSFARPSEMPARDVTESFLDEMQSHARS